MLIARKTLCQLLMTRAIAVEFSQHLDVYSLEEVSQEDCRLQTIPSVPSDNVPNFCSNASICDATAALRSRNSRRFSSSAFFSLTRATNAGDCPADDAEPAIEGCRMCGWMDRAGKDMTVVRLVVNALGCWRQVGGRWTPDVNRLIDQR